MDGGSTDETLAILEDLDGIGMTVRSSPDRGLYDAVAKGFGAAGGDLVAYLNCGDFYHPAAFDVVLDVMEQHRGIDWLTGMVVEYNERSHVVDAWTPPAFCRRLFDCGLYGTRLEPVQQESTFWSAALLDEVDLDVLASCRLAGDFYLWKQFAARNQLYVVHSYLGGFRKHVGQLSSGLDDYRNELRRLAARRPGGFDYLLGCQAKIGKYMPLLVKKRLSGGRLLSYNQETGRYE